MRRKLLVAIFGLASLAGLALAFSRPPTDALLRVPFSRVLLDRDGKLLGASIADDEQWRFPVAQAVPRKYRDAVIQFEDRRFEIHPGIDPLAVLRAAVNNLSQQRVVSGASTLTMQVVRLARGNRERTFTEKLVEATRAFQLELLHSKEEILALYAGHAPFGGNVVGLSAAAWRYFGRAPEHLSWAEIATLTVLPNSPALIHPGRNRDRLRAKRDGLLRDLHESGALNALELDLAVREPLPLAPRPLPRFAPHLLASLTATSPAASSTFHSTLDLALQARAIERVSHHASNLESAGVYNAAALILDNETMEVRAYVGNAQPNYAMRNGLAIDLIQRPRSTGSILKPFLFAAMLENGDLLPETLVSDVPTQYGGYQPENYDHAYRGAVPARIALARSLNVPAVRMLRHFGVARFRTLLKGLGMSTLHRNASDYGLTLILGGAEGSLWDITRMYANLARTAASGQDLPTQGQVRILAGTEAKHRAPGLIGPGAAWLTLDALTDVIRPESEGGWREFADARHIAWKTGTSYGLRDAWAVGTTPEFTIGVWVGNASGAGVAGLSGVDMAAPLLFDLFDGVATSTGFDRPADKLRAVQVCTDNGYLANDFCESKQVWAPKTGHFNRITPHHTLVHLDPSRSYRVDSRCASVAKMESQPWFVLPPSEEHYFRSHHSQYRPLPPVHPACRGALASLAAAAPMALLYPNEHTGVYIPTDLDGEKSRAVFEAVHREQSAVVHWHLDERYVASTRTFHQVAIHAQPGPHRLTLVDQAGRLLERTFLVLGDKTP